MSSKATLLHSFLYLLDSEQGVHRILSMPQPLRQLTIQSMYSAQHYADLYISKQISQWSAFKTRLLPGHADALQPQEILYELYSRDV